MVEILLSDETPVFLYDEKGQRGPISYRQARFLWSTGQVDDHGYYWAGGMPDWKPARDLFPTLPIESDTVVDSGLRLRPIAVERKVNRVLVVDDDLLMREMIGDLLDQEGIFWEKAEDIAPAKILLQEKGLEYFDAIITDYQTITGSGVDLVHWIKQRENALQILLLTAKDDKEVIKSGLRAGVLDFLEKPLRRKNLIPALKTAIQQTVRQREERQAYMELIRQKLAGRTGAVESLMTDLVHRESSLGGLLVKLETALYYSEELEKRNSEVVPGSVEEVSDMPFQGQITDLSLLDLIQLLSQSSKTGELQILSMKKVVLGSIFLMNGRLVHASNSNQKGRQALGSLMECKDGFFCFHYGKKTLEKSLFEDPISILLSLSAEMDQKQKALAA
jgi:FixJ family two-component response regulator